MKPKLKLICPREVKLPKLIKGITLNEWWDVEKVISPVIGNTPMSMLIACKFIGKIYFSDNKAYTFNYKNKSPMVLK